jgi:hypothetical protein
MYSSDPGGLQGAGGADLTWVRLVALLVWPVVACSSDEIHLPAEPDAAPMICPALASWERLPVGCEEDPARCAPPRALADDDGDGLSEAQGDCDDDSPYVAPEAPEVCDLRDNDCDGEADEGGVCAAACPVSSADARCCGARHTIAGSFYELRTVLPTPYTPGNGFADPFVVMVRRRATGELRMATTCPAPPETDYGYPFRFHLDDRDFVSAGEQYELLIHLRWYFPAVLEPEAWCWLRAPVVTADAETAAVCVDFGPLVLSCL